MKKEMEIYVYRSVGMSRSFSLYHEALRLKKPDSVVDGYCVYSGGVLGDAESDAYCKFEGFDKQAIISRFSYPLQNDRNDVDVTIYRKIYEGFEVSYGFNDIDAAELFTIDEHVTRQLKKMQVFPAVITWMQ